jgi:hypothetical protein
MPGEPVPLELHEQDCGIQLQREPMDTSAKTGTVSFHDKNKRSRSRALENH